MRKPKSSPPLAKFNRCTSRRESHFHLAGHAPPSGLQALALAQVPGPFIVRVPFSEHLGVDVDVEVINLR
jgi:hypothetical protein